MKIAYGITTIPERRDSLLPRTTESLASAGFDRPHIFIDGATSSYDELRRWDGLRCTCHYPKVKVAGNWILSMYELYIRNHDADRFILFQDDLVAYRGLRQYLEEVPYPEHGYCNLYCFPANERRIPSGYTGWYRTEQRGWGALGLMFSIEALENLFTQRCFFNKPRHVDEQGVHRGWKSIDGAIVTAMNIAGWSEYVHYPSLIQHTGMVSSFCKHKTATGLESSSDNYKWSSNLLANSFKGEDYDATDLLKNSPRIGP